MKKRVDTFPSRKTQFVELLCTKLPHQVESTSSRPITEVQQLWAALVQCIKCNFAHVSYRVGIVKTKIKLRYSESCVENKFFFSLYVFGEPAVHFS